MILNIEKNENKLMARFWLAYVFAGLIAITVLLLSGCYKSACLSTMPITASLFYIVFSALICYVFIFLIWATVVYYHRARGIEYIGIRYFWAYYACMLFGLAYSAIFLKYINFFPTTKLAHFTLPQFLVYLEKHHCAIASFPFADFPLILLMIVMTLTLPVIYYMLLRLDGKIETDKMNSRGTAVKSRQKMLKKFVSQCWVHLIFIAVLTLLAYLLHYLVFILLR